MCEILKVRLPTKTFLRIGGSYLSEIESAISIFRKFGNKIPQTGCLGQSRIREFD